MFSLRPTSLVFYVAGALALWSGCGDSSVGGDGKGRVTAVETITVPQIVVAGQTFSVTCAATDSTKLPVPAETTFVVTPDAPSSVSQVTPTVPGTYQVACELADGSIRDETPALVYVIGVDDLDKVVVDTSLSKGTAAIGEAVTVTCQVALDGLLLDGILTDVRPSPAEGITITNHSVTGTQDGEWGIACGVANTDFVDASPATLIVGAGLPEPAKVVTVLDKHTVAAGDTVQVSCSVTAADGTVLNDATVVEAPNGVGITDHTLTAQQVGTFDIVCKLAEPEGSPELIGDELVVVAGEPVSVKAWADPTKASYDPGDVVTIKWEGTDAFGNLVEEPPATVTGPSQGVAKLEAAKYEMLEDGEYTFTVTLTGGSGAQDTVTIIVDGSGPLIVITSPERGQTFDGDGNIVVTGTAHDEFGGIESFTVNGYPVTLGADGSWSFTLSSAHGLNVVVAEAMDKHENAGKATVAWYYSTDWVLDDAASPDEAWIQDGLRVWASQQIIDDNDHTEATIDDIAHLLEILLTYVDFTTILGKPVLYEQLFPDVVSVKDIGGLGIDLQGDMKLWADVDKIEFGKATLNLKSRNGGIDVFAKFAKDGDEPGMTVHIKVHVQLTLIASGTFDTPFGPVPASAAVSPPPTVETTTTLTIDELGLDTSFDIWTSDDGELHVLGKKLLITPKGFDLAPLAAATLDLGKVTFSVAGIPLPIEIDLPKADLSGLVSGLSGIIGSLLNPILDTFIPLATAVLEPLISVFGGDAVKAALESLEIDQDIEIPELVPGQPLGSINVKAKISDVGFTAAGGAFGLSAGAVAEKKIDRNPLGSILRDACLGKETGTYTLPKSGPMEMAISLDVLNEVLFSLWWNGGLQLDLDGKDLGDLSSFGVTSAKIELNPLLPPIFSDCNAKSTLKIQLGDAYIKADVMLSNLPIEFEAWLSAEVDVGLIAEGKEIGINVNGVSLFEIEIFNAKGPFEGKEESLQSLVEGLLLENLLGMLTGSALGSFPLPSFDIGGLAEGVPPGTVIGLDNLKVTKTKGFLQIEGTLQ